MRHFTKDTKASNNATNAASDKKETPEAPVKEEKKETVKKEEKDTKKKAAAEDSSSSSSEEEGNGSTLSREDVKQIKKLISEQEVEIEKLKEQTKQLKEKLVYQLAENDNTIKRYKKEIDSTREFAISKFAKDLLDVRDNLERGSEHIKGLKYEEQSDIAELKKYIE